MRVPSGQITLLTAALAVGAIAVLFGVPSAAVDQPQFQARLQSSFASGRSQPGDTVQAVTISPIIAGSKVSANSGCALTGRVVESLRPKGVNARELIAVEFTQLVDLRKVSHPISTHLVEVDNARETVDDHGRILGVAPVEKKPTDAGDVLGIAAKGIPIMRALVSKVIGRLPPQIDYKPGVELTLQLAKPLAPSPVTCSVIPPVEVPANAVVLKLALAQPLRSTTRDENKSADLVNLMFVGSQKDLEAAFTAANWMTASAANAETSVKTFLAVAAGQGYKEGPVSLQLLAGTPPALVFQKQFNTFAKRHHIRVWKRTGAPGLPDIWVAAATHDNAIIVTKAIKFFTHGIDPALDDERTKVINDLAFAGSVQRLSWVARPKAPHTFTNGSGEDIRTDGRLAVVTLRGQ